MNPSIPLRPRVKLDYSLFHEDSKFNRWLKTRRTRNLFLKEKAASNKKATGSAEKNKSKKENVELNDKAGDKMFWWDEYFQKRAWQDIQTTPELPI